MSASARSAGFLAHAGEGGLESPPHADRKVRWPAILEYLLAFLLVAGLCLRAGSLSAGAGQVNWEGLAAVGHAEDIWYRAPEPRLSEIGYVQPPLPSLLASLAVIPRPPAAETPFAPARLGAVLLGLTAVILLAMARALGLAWPWRYLLAAGVVLHPVPLSQAAAGSPAALLLPLLLGSLWCLDRWAATGSLRPLLIASVLLGAGVLTRYEMLLWVLLAAGLVAVVAWRAGGYRQAEGTLLAFLLPTAYLGAGWIAACWLIQGDPWYFWRYTFGGPPHAVGNLLLMALYLGLLCSPLLPAGVYAMLRGHGREKTAVSLLLGAGGLVLAGLATPLLGRLAGDAWSQLTVPLLAAMAGGYLLAARTVRQAQQLGWGRQAAAGVLAVAGIAAVLLAGHAGGGLPRGMREALQGNLAFTDSAQAEQQVAQRLRAELRPGETAVVAGWPGFAVALLGGDLGRLALLSDPRPPAKALPEAGEVLLVAEPEAGQLRATWQQTLGAELREVWRVDSWTCYRRGKATQDRGGHAGLVQYGVGR